ncbi:MAG: TIGR01212 family radical SAM protein [Bacteroidales bacterium]|nr:TIGR01212 family radical SAM protein [Bacteroidales bacterium]
MVHAWGDETPFYTYHQYLNNTFGHQIRKIPVDAGFTCPNRDGTCGRDGCTFCLNEAFAPRYCDSQKRVSQQVADGVAFHAHRRRNMGAILVYFQSYSNTYAPLEMLKRRYEEALAVPEVQGLVIATRPDCLSEETLDYLSALQKHSYICVEIGIESLHDKTLRRVNRGHDAACTLHALSALAQREIPTCGHLIFGLPGETPEMWMQDIAILNHVSLSTLKLHQLQILQGTPIAQEYAIQPEDFHSFTAESYMEFLADYLERLSPDIAIERLANEVPPRYLNTNTWHGLRHQDIVQGVCVRLQKRQSWQGIKKAEVSTPPPFVS